MGQKVNPIGFRLFHGTGTWSSRWFDARRGKAFLKQDVMLREFLLKKLAKAGVTKIDIERSVAFIKVIVKTAKPGLLIGRGGSGAETLRDDIKKFLVQFVNKKAKMPEIKLEIEEVKNPESDAKAVAMNIKEQIEKRLPFRRVLKQSIEKVSQAQGVAGVKIKMGGRLDGAEISRSEWLAKGKIPLQTLRAYIDYATETAFTTYGTIGIKVWIYKGEK